jgi:tetratricopeptide (TPR) repeat protein
MSPPLAPAHARVSLCLIVRNEEANLPDCVGPLANLFFEIVVVDTGSTDATKEAAKALGARVFDFRWIDSFSAARNQSLLHATGDWIFWLDADDRIDAANRHRLADLFAHLTAENRAYGMNHSSPYATMPDSPAIVKQVRLFRKHPGVRWRYRAHEQILPSLRESGAEVTWTDIVIDHLGFRHAANLRQKLERNLRLMRLDLSEHPDDPLLLFHVASTSVELGKGNEILPLLERCILLAPRQATYLPRACLLSSQILRDQGRLRPALEICSQARARFPADADLLLEEGVLRLALNDPHQAQHCFEQILRLPPAALDVALQAGFQILSARRHLAVALLQQGQVAAAETELRAIVRECPSFSAAWLSLVDLQLDQHRRAEVDDMIAALQADPALQPIVALVRARVCMFARDFPAARTVLEDAVAKFPALPWLRLAHCVVLLNEGIDLAAAAEMLEQLLQADPGNLQASAMLDFVRRQTTTRQTPPAT